MDKLKQQLEQRLKANILIDKCAHCDGVIFRDAWCTQDRVIRFTTPFFRQLFHYAESENGPWKTGDAVMYEVENTPNALEIRCLISLAVLPQTLRDIGNRLCKACGTVSDFTATVSLKSWCFSSAGDKNKLFDDFDRFLQSEVPSFESKTADKLGAEDLLLFREGAEESITSDKYERNREARAACLAAHGTACAVCGIDFEKEYGSEFAGKIEVHHIVPLSQIGTEYTVDPVRDLIPVCPNCHTALHSKKDGVYTVTELRALRSRIIRNQ